MGEYIADSMFWYGNLNHKEPYRSLVRRALTRKLKKAKSDRLIIKASKHIDVYNKDMKRRYLAKKSEAGAHGKGFELSFARFKFLMESECFYCGFGQAECIDRVDNAKGYSRGNSVSCCIPCNSSKNNHNLLSWVIKNKEKLAEKWLLNKAVA